MYIFKAKKNDKNDNIDKFLAFDDIEYITIPPNLLFTSGIWVLSFDDYQDMIKYYTAHKSAIEEDTKCNFSIVELLTGNEHDIEVS